MPNTRGHNRRIRSVIVGNNRLNVKCDIDGRIKSCGARSLQVVREDEGLPVNKVPTTNASYSC